MKLRYHIHLLIFGILMVSPVIFTSCDALDEDLPECRLFVKFKYDYNMESVNSFHKCVDKVELYVFDKDGKFIFKQSEKGEALGNGNYRMEVEVPVGEYQFMAWAGTGGSYDITECTRGTTDMQEMTLKLRRPSSFIVNQQLERLWYGEMIDVSFTGQTNQEETINLIHDTNVVTFLFQSTIPDSWKIEMDDYEYEILESNGYLGYDNNLLSDDELSYQPYHMEQKSAGAVKVEISTMRLMADRDTRFIVTEKATGTQVMNISLRDFLAMTLSQYKGWGVQEYFDREWEWDIVFFLSDSWTATQININNWTWYNQEEGG